MKTKKIEFRVREVRRYIVTRFHQQEMDDSQASCSSSSVIGEYDNADTAYAVGYAMCRNEHSNLGWPIADERIIYPSHPESAAVGTSEPFTSSHKF